MQSHLDVVLFVNPGQTQVITHGAWLVPRLKGRSATAPTAQNHTPVPSGSTATGGGAQCCGAAGSAPEVSVACSVSRQDRIHLRSTHPRAVKQSRPKCRHDSLCMDSRLRLKDTSDSGFSKQAGGQQPRRACL